MPNVANLMPGVHFKEVEFAGASKPIASVGISAGAIVGYFEKGEIDKAVLVTSLVEFEQKYGGPIANAFSWYAVDGFFKNGGKMLYVVRTTKHDGQGVTSAVVANRKIKNGSALDVLRVDALNAGAWGNNISVKVTQGNLVDAKVTEIATVGALSFKVDKIAGIEVGNELNIASTPVSKVTVEKVDAATKTVYVTTPLVTALAVNNVVSTKEYNVTIAYKGEAVEVFKGLTLLNLENNIISRINNGSAYVRLAKLADATDLAVDADFVKFTTGDDALNGVADADLIGQKAKFSGMYALDLIPEVFNLFCVESESANLNRAFIDYCESRMNAFAIVSVPADMDYNEAIEYRVETGAFGSSYGALYYQHGYVNDPLGIGKNPEKLVPLDGHIAGLFARIDERHGYEQNPAGEIAKLIGVNSLEHTLNSTMVGLLNDKSINSLMTLSNVGHVVWGCRTLSPDLAWRYIHKRRIFILVEMSLVQGTRWSVFRPNAPATWKSINRSVVNFLDTVSGLAGAKREERFVVINDESVNTQSVIDQGIIMNRVGLNVAGVGEFIWFEIGQSREGVSLTEL